MTNDKKDHRDVLDRVAAKLADDLFDTPDNALLKEVRDDGGDPQAVAARGLAIFEKAAILVAKSRLAAAKAAVAATRHSHQNVIPIPPAESRALLTRVLAQHPEATSKLTLAARKAAGQASDADIRDMLEDLSELGISSTIWAMVERIGTAERVLRRLGIDDPREIDVDAIAWDMGARVKYRPLDSCEARIVGIGDHAVITVNERSKLPRRRFSVAHELGHWTYHRHHLLMCRKEDIGTSFSPHSPERAADLFARDLLMPRFLFDPVARSYPKVTFAKVREIATLFQTSRTATAIRLVEGGFVSALLICHGSAGRKWFVPSPDVCSWCFPNNELSPDSFAFDILFGSKDEDPFPRRIGADAWFSYRGADRHEVLEQTVRVADQTILTLLFIEDDEMVAS